MRDRLKSLVVRVWRVFHWHDWDKAREVDCVRRIWPFRAPYVLVCWCGATKLKES